MVSRKSAIVFVQPLSGTLQTDGSCLATQPPRQIVLDLHGVLKSVLEPIWLYTKRLQEHRPIDYVWHAGLMLKCRWLAWAQ